MSLADHERDFYLSRDVESLVARGMATAPAAGATIVTVAAPPKGYYEITAIGRYGGVADVIDNMELRVGAAAVLVLPVLPVVNGTPVPVTVKKLLSGAEAVSINAVALGGAGSVFVGHLVLTKISNVN